MKDLNGSRTQANLMAAFAGESQARNKYTYYAAKAKKEGFEQISEIFTETADNEKEHAKIWFKLLHNGIPATLDNLQDAASGEHYEWTEMYLEFSRIAKEEGFDEISNLFKMVSEIEKEHEERYKKLIENLKADQVFKKSTQQKWICSNCGHVVSGNDAPEVCPVCAHPKAYFKIKPENY